MLYIGYIPTNCVHTYVHTYRVLITGRGKRLAQQAKKKVRVEAVSLTPVEPALSRGVTVALNQSQAAALKVAASLPVTLQKNRLVTLTNFFLVTTFFSFSHCLSVPLPSFNYYLRLLIHNNRVLCAASFSNSQKYVPDLGIGI